MITRTFISEKSCETLSPNHSLTLLDFLKSRPPNARPPKAQFHLGYIMAHNVLQHWGLDHVSHCAASLKCEIMSHSVLHRWRVRSCLTLCCIIEGLDNGLQCAAALRIKSCLTLRCIIQGLDHVSHCAASLKCEIMVHNVLQHWGLDHVSHCAASLKG